MIREHIHISSFMYNVPSEPEWLQPFTTSYSLQLQALSNICPLTISPISCHRFIQAHWVGDLLFLPSAPITFNVSCGCRILQILFPHCMFQNFQSVLLISIKLPHGSDALSKIFSASSSCRNTSVVSLQSKLSSSVRKRLSNQVIFNFNITTINEQQGMIVRDL